MTDFISFCDAFCPIFFAFVFMILLIIWLFCYLFKYLKTVGQREQAEIQRDKAETDFLASQAELNRLMLTILNSEWQHVSVDSEIEN